MRKILVPIDFSPESLNAFRYAIQLADVTGGSIHLLHVIPLDYAGIDVPMSVTINAKSQEEFARKRMVEFTSEALTEIEAVKQLDKVPDIHSDVRVGTPLFSILEAAVKCDLLIMGTRGNRKTALEKLSNLTAKVVKDAPCSMLVVPETARFSQISRLLYASEFKKEDPYYVWKALQLLDPIAAVVDIVHVREEGKSRMRDNAEKLRVYLNENAVGMNTMMHEYAATDVEVGLLEYAEQTDVDLIVMYVPKYNFMDFLFHRSHTKRMSKLTNVPLLVIRAEK